MKRNVVTVEKIQTDRVKRPSVFGDKDGKGAAPEWIAFRDLMTGALGGLETDQVAQVVLHSDSFEDGDAEIVQAFHDCLNDSVYRRPAPDAITKRIADAIGRGVVAITPDSEAKTLGEDGEKVAVSDLFSDADTVVSWTRVYKDDPINHEIGGFAVKRHKAPANK
jgi:hypothetical protein